MFRRVLVASVLSALTGVVTAATPNAKPATKPKVPAIQSSPSLDVLGLRLGAEFTLPECPIDPALSRYVGPRYKYAHEMTGSMPCFQQGYAPKPGFVLDKSYASLEVMIDPLPAGLRQDSIDVKVIDGRIENVSAGTYGLKSQEGLLELLTEKYGSPTTLNHSKVQNRMGAEFNQVDATWKFSDLTITFVGMGSTIDWGIIEISTPKANAVAEAKREEAKAAAPKL
ncbi:hypothetical protein J2X06_002460 [Lysobacter niastensis]|uniref:Secreted protein n=1 Tax=Lysobacter niastensis TaxID=380629 RepID=A0ABU1WC70_9GAMM|nr:hypothetical protein [Lysobacter niastensis]MDR7135251.1 hypothetical protein [Lysobacter niastensis]